MSINVSSSVGFSDDLSSSTISLHSIKSGGSVTHKKTKRPSSAGFSRLYKNIPFVCIVLTLTITSVVIPVIVTVSMMIIYNNDSLRTTTVSDVNGKSNCAKTVLVNNFKNIEDIFLTHDMLYSTGVYDISQVKEMSKIALSSLRASGLAFITFVTPDGSVVDVLLRGGNTYGMFLQNANKTSACLYQVLDINTMTTSILPDWCILGNFSEIMKFSSPFVDDIYSIPRPRWSPIVNVSTTDGVIQCIAYVGSATSNISGSHVPHNVTSNITGSQVFHNVGWTMGLISVILDDIYIPDGFGFLVDTSTTLFLGNTPYDGDNMTHHGSLTDGAVAVTSVNLTSVQKAVKFIINEFGSWENVPEVTQSKWVTDDTIISTSKITRSGLSWVFVAVSKPRLQIVQWSLIGTVLSIMLVFVGIAVIFSMWITTPIKNMSRNMKEIVALDFGHHIDMDHHWRLFNCLKNRIHPFSDEIDVENAIPVNKPRSNILEIREFQKCYDQLSSGTMAMTKFVPKQIVLQLMKHSSNGNVPLMMKSKHLAILFTDIRGFTTLSEILDENQIVKVMKLWFEGFGQVITNNSGTIDKFIGDCIMALYGAPIDADKPAHEACCSALMFKEVMETVRHNAIKIISSSHGMVSSSRSSLEGSSKTKSILRPSSHEKSSASSKVTIVEPFENSIMQKAIKIIDDLDYRVGIHEGLIKVGFTGYSDRVNYTVCGNDVNTASRLEQLGKDYKLCPLTSGVIKQSTCDEFLFEFIDVVTLRGHENTKTRVYHLICPRKDAKQSDCRRVEAFENIHRLVKNGDSAGALIELASASTKPNGCLCDDCYVSALRTLKSHIEDGVLNTDSYENLDWF